MFKGVKEPLSNVKKNFCLDVNKNSKINYKN